MHRFCCWHFSCMLTLSHFKINDLFGVVFVCSVRCYPELHINIYAAGLYGTESGKDALNRLTIDSKLKKQKARNKTQRRRLRRR